MGSQLIVSIVVGICILALIGIVTRSKIIGILTRIAISCMMIIVMNCLLPQYMIAVNLYTVGFSTLLGVPGLMTLYLLQVFV